MSAWIIGRKCWLKEGQQDRVIKDKDKPTEVSQWMLVQMSDFILFLIIHPLLSVTFFLYVLFFPFIDLPHSYFTILKKEQIIVIVLDKIKA